jgi:hypothetical protein
VETWRSDEDEDQDVRELSHGSQSGARFDLLKSAQFSTARELRTAVVNVIGCASTICVMPESILASIVGSELGSVVFVMDYVQLVFQPSEVAPPEPGFLRPTTEGTFATLSTWALPHLLVEGRHLRPGDAGWRDLLVEQINARIVGQSETSERLLLALDSGVSLTVPLDGDIVESAMLQVGEGDPWMVWAPGGPLSF